MGKLRSPTMESRKLWAKLEAKLSKMTLQSLCNVRYGVTVPNVCTSTVSAGRRCNVGGGSSRVPSFDSRPFIWRLENGV